jgi:tetratricopeptide (TPR) repeat protein
VKKTLFSFVALLGVIAATAQSLNEGLTAMYSNRFGEAKNQLKALLGKGNDAEIYFYLGKVYQTTEQFDSAKICFDLGVAANPKKALPKIGQIQMNLKNGGDVTSATNEMAMAVKLEAKNVKVLIEAARALYSEKARNTEAAWNYLNRAKLAKKDDFEVKMAWGDYYMTFPDSGGAAVNNYEDAALFNPASGRPHERIGEIFFRNKNYGDSKAAYEQSINKDMQYAPAYRGLGELEFQAKKYKAAAENYSTYLQIADVTIEAETRYASFLFLADEYEKANQEISKIQKIDASNPILYRLTAYGNFEQGKKSAFKEEGDSLFNSAMQSMNQFFAKANPSKIIVNDYEYAGRINAKVGNADAAVENLKKAISLDSTKRTELWGEIGDVYNKARRYSDAAAAFETKNSYLPKVSAADYFTVGRAYYFGKNLVAADSAFSKVISAKPEAYLGYLWRAKTNAQTDTALQFQEATTFFKQFLMMVDTSTADKSKFKKDQQDALSYLMTYNVQKDNIPTAKEYAAKVLALDPMNSTAQRIINFQGTSRKQTVPAKGTTPVTDLKAGKPTDPKAGKPKTPTTAPKK